jgi:hypothetical protein
MVGVGLAPITLTLAGQGQGPRHPLLPSLDGFFLKIGIRGFPIFNYLININSFD